MIVFFLIEINYKSSHIDVTITNICKCTLIPLAKKKKINITQLFISANSGFEIQCIVKIKVLALIIANKGEENLTKCGESHFNCGKGNRAFQCTIVFSKSFF